MNSFIDVCQVVAGYANALVNSIFCYVLYLNNYIFAIPAMFLFLGTGIFLTLWTHGIQIWGLRRFIRLLTHGIPQQETTSVDVVKQTSTVSPIRALFTALTTSMGMGNIVGPTVAIIAGGPGALFWMLIYIFFGSVTRLAEVVFAFNTREYTDDGRLVGGPMFYLKKIHPLLALWYTIAMMILFISWASVQSNTLATILAHVGISPMLVGIVLSIIAMQVLKGGVQRVSAVASKLVPLMFVLYITFSFLILFKDISLLSHAIKSVFASAFSPSAFGGAFAGTTLMMMMHAGVYKAIFITEAGLGSSSIAHAVASTKYALDQGILALFSAIANMILCTISGLLVLVTGVWMTGDFRSTLIYEAFKGHAPFGGTFILLICIMLFVTTTIIGNTFNGVQTCSSLTGYRGVRWYLWVTCIAIILGAFIKTSFVWLFTDLLLTFVAIPNLIGILILSYQNRDAIINRS